MGKRKSRDSKENRRKLFLYKPEQIKRALDAIKSGTPVSTAVKLFNVPRTTLRHKVSGKAPETSGKVGPTSVLGIEIEDDLVTWLKMCAQMGFPVDKDGLLYSVKRIVEEKNVSTPFKDNVPGKTWLNAFMARHPDLSVKRSEYINKARANITEEKIRKWFSDTEKLLGEEAEILKHPSRIWNMDETAFFLNPTGGLIFAEKGKPVYGTSANSDKDNVTTLVTVNAVGELSPPLTIYKFDRLPYSYMKAAPSEWGIGKSENGWMTSKTFYEYFTNVLHPFFVEKKYELPVIIFVDGHSSHLSLQLSYFCRENKIIVVCLTPNTTHILQPLDVAVFFPLKTQWRKALKKWRIDHNGQEIKKQEVPQLLSQIFKNHSFQSSIVNGFRKCGLFPYDADNVDYSKCTLKLTEIDNANVVNNSEPQLATNEVNNINHLEYLESKIESNILDCFKEHNLCSTKPDAKYEFLYDVWLKFKEDVNPNDITDHMIMNKDNHIANTNDILNDIIVDEENQIIEFPFPELNIDDVILGTEHFRIHHKEHLENTLNQKDNKVLCEVEVHKAVVINKILDVNNPTNEEHITADTALEASLTEAEGNGQNVDKRIRILSNIIVKPDVSKENIIPEETDKKVIGDILKLPVFPNTVKKRKITKSNNVSVLTSNVWVANEEEKEKKKQDTLLEKEERKKKRELAKLEKNATKKDAKIKRKFKKRKESNDDLDHDELEGEDNMINDKQEANIEDNVVELSKKTIVPNTFVIVEYENTYYPGQVLEARSEGFLVSTMTKSGVQYWKWPDEKDQIIYSIDEIQEIIKSPQKKNARGAFFVPEMRKYDSKSF